MQSVPKRHAKQHIFLHKVNQSSGLEFIYRGIRENFHFEKIFGNVRAQQSGH
jgi:hypothetical protein